eukprot:scaffold389_cov382-Prasinococcus_capsulatus_cf.AAC.13
MSISAARRCAQPPASANAVTAPSSLGPMLVWAPGSQSRWHSQSAGGPESTTGQQSGSNGGGPPGHRL